MNVKELSPTTRAFNNFSFLMLMFGLPLFVCYAILAVVQHGGAVVLPDANFWSGLPGINWTVVAVYLGWLLFQGFMFHFLPGKTEAGQPLKTGERLNYKLNGMLSFLISIGLWATLHFTGLVPGNWIYLHFAELFIAANVIAWPFALCMFFLGRRQATDEEKQTNALEAFFVGATLNPRIGSFDWKFFAESRPGLTLWVLVALSCAAHQYETSGFITNSMLLTSFFVTLYIADYYFHEDAILTTWDMVHEPFGWMLCWGSLIYVPFFYPMAALWLAENPYVLPSWAAVAIGVLGLTGYVIFRQCNIQKHHFRKNLQKKIWGKPPEFIQTQRGSKLLVSGWWGVASHANYLGDLMLSFAMCVVVGTGSIFGYSYFLVFVPLLLHRDWRDDKHCADKYGDDWKAYRKRVRWHIVPGIY